MKNKIVFTDTSQGISGLVDDSHIYGGVEFTQEANNAEDLDFGATACSTIKFTSDVLNSSSIGHECDYYIWQENDSNWRLIGHYTVVEAKRNKTKFDIVAYDNIYKFDKVIDEWLDDVTFPITLTNLFKSLVKYCFNASDDSWAYTAHIPANANQLIPDNFTSTNITGRTVLSYMAQAAAGFAYAMPNGKISIRGYQSTQKTLDRTKYVSYEYADYTAPAITKVLIAPNDDEGTTPVTSGSGNSVLRIIANPFLIGETIAELQPFANNIYSAVSGYSYTPMKIELLEDFGINVGDIITVNNVATLVMNKSFNASGVTLESTGNKERDTQAQSLAGELNNLRGSYSKLKVDLNEITLEVGNAKEDIAQLQITADGITSTISGNANYTESNTEPEDPITGDIWKNTANNSYYQWDGTEWLSITESEAKNLKLVNKIGQTLDGVIYQNNFGTTVINGSNITTGTINADRINMTGAISWGDMNSDMKSRISSSGGIYRQDNPPSNPNRGDLWYCTNQSSQTYEYETWYTWNGRQWTATEVPDYIHSTYIGPTTIQSPTIEANNIDVYGGTFRIHDITGTALYGYVGRGKGNNGIRQTEGIILAFNNPRTTAGLDLGDSYIICTESGARMTIGQNSLYVTESGVYKTINGVSSPLGYCVFA